MFEPLETFSLVCNQIKRRRKWKMWRFDLLQMEEVKKSAND